jgi:virginiamycin B lyase
MNRTLVLVVSTLMVVVGCSSTASTPIPATSSTSTASSSAVAVPVATVSPVPSPSPRPTASFFAALPSARPVQPVATISVGGRLSGLTVAGPSIWVLGGRGAVRIDPSTDKVAATFPLTADLTGNSMAVGAGSVWASAFDGNTVTRLDAKTGRRLATIAAGPNPAQIIYADGSVWVSEHRGGTVSRIDPATNTIVATIQVGSTGPSGPTFLASGGGSIWVSIPNDETIVRVDPTTNKVTATIHVGHVDAMDAGGPMAVDTVAGWAVLQSDSNAGIARIDPTTNAITARLIFPGVAGSPLVNDGVIWVPNSVQDADGVRQLLAIDPATNTVVDALEIPGGDPNAVVSAFGSVWVELGRQGEVERFPLSALSVQK